MFHLSIGGLSFILFKGFQNSFDLKDSAIRFPHLFLVFFYIVVGCMDLET
jgi:hypothetical protein